MARRRKSHGTSKNRRRWQEIKRRYYLETGRHLTTEEALRLGLITPEPPAPEGQSAQRPVYGRRLAEGALRPPAPNAPPGVQRRQQGREPG